MQVSLLALALALVSLWPHSAAASPPPARGTRPVIAGAEEKQRVPKPAPEQPRTKNDKPGSSSGSTSSSDDDSGGLMESCLSECLGSCIDGTFSAILEGIFSSKRAAPALADSTAALGPPATEPGSGVDTSDTATPYEPHAWAQLDVGYLRAYLPGDSVVLRRGHSDPDSVQIEAGRLPDGARVLVTTTHGGPGGAMLEVRPVDSQGPSGWVHEKSVRATPFWSSSSADTSALEAAPPVAGASTMTGTESPAATTTGELSLTPSPPDSGADSNSRTPASQIGGRWAVVFGIGPAAIENPELAQEYPAGASTFETEYLRHVKSAWVVGAGAGYRGYFGTPRVEYVGVTQIDAPEHSRFRLTYGMVEFGQRHAWAKGLRLGYMIGPVLGYVYEDATVHVLDAGTRARLGARHEVLGRWAAGGGATTWLGLGRPIPLELGLRFRIFGLAWAGQREKSLTSDYTDEGLLHIDGAITFTYAGH